MSEQQHWADMSRDERLAAWEENKAIEQVPSDYVRLPIRNEMEVALWLCPNGSKYVQLKDESEATWESYCARLAKDNAAEMAERKRFKPS
jgi:hypothetical protein